MQDLWSATLPLLRARTGERNFLAWIEPIRCYEMADASVSLEVPSRFFRDWVAHHFLSEISETLAQVAGQPRLVRLVIRDVERREAKGTSYPPKSGGRPKGGLEVALTRALQKIEALPGRLAQFRNLAQAMEQARKPRLVVDSDGPLHHPKIGRLVPHYTFDGFVVGPSNEVAFRVAKSVSAQPAKQYNPVFLHGSVGLGKTHLINAIAHDLLARYPRMRLACLSAEAFMNTLIGSLRGDQMSSFRDKFREVDTLILDDVQFLAGKERTQEEFFHTFNALHGDGKQIVLTSDKAPAAMNGLEHRLRSRFEGGIITDVKPPTFEMRRSILRVKAARQGMELSDEVADYLAWTAGPSVRELEGALTRLTANATVRGVPLTLSLAEELLSPVVPFRKVTVENIQDAVSRRFGLTVSDLKSERHGRDVTLARQIAMYLSRAVASASFRSIAEKFERGHSSVMHAVRVIGERRAADASLSRILTDLDVELREPPAPCEMHRPASIEDVQRVVSRHFNVATADIRSRTRSLTLALPQQIAMYLSRKVLGASIGAIAKEFGDYEERTVLRFVRVIDERRSCDAELNRMLATIENTLRSTMFPAYVSSARHQGATMFPCA